MLQGKKAEKAGFFPQKMPDLNAQIFLKFAKQAPRA